MRDEMKRYVVVQDDGTEKGDVTMTYRNMTCPNCEALIDIDDCVTDKYWTNSGDHVLIHICPECGEVVEDVDFNGNFNN